MVSSQVWNTIGLHIVHQATGLLNLNKTNDPAANDDTAHIPPPPPPPPPPPVGPSPPVQKGEEVAAALAVSCSVGARGRGGLEMSLSWDMPTITFGSGERRHDRYCRPGTLLGMINALN